MSNLNVKLNAQATFRYPSDWDVVIKQSQEEKAAWIREAVRRRLIEENLMESNESYFSHEVRSVAMNTSNTLNTKKNSNVFRSLLTIFGKQQAQKKTDCTRSFSAHSSQG